MISPSIVRTPNTMELEIPLLARLSYSDLKERFDNLGSIGSGGEAVVFKVRSKSNGVVYALRLDSMMQTRNLGKREIFFKHMIDSQDATPHRVKMFAAFWVENKNYPFFGGSKKGVLPLSELQEGEFLRRDFASDPEATTYYHEAIIMDLGEEDCETTMKDVEPAIFDIQSIFNDYCHNKTGISASDDKYRNYVWMSIDNENYNGKSLKDFKYWLYSFGENSVDIYIPRQNFIPKRVDFSCWEIIKGNEKQNKNWNEILSRNLKMSIKELLRSYPKPDVPEEEILDMGALLKQ